MKLSHNPTVEELRELIHQGEDGSGNHILWVKKNGEVKLSRIDGNESAAQFLKKHPDMRLRFEMFEAGNEYVGPEAARDDQWMAELYERLLTAWAKAKGNKQVEVVDKFL